MGASLLHGKELVLRQSASGDCEELIPVDGDYHFPAYSSVGAVVRLCQQQGISEEAWPIYYGISSRDVPLAEVREKCGRLRRRLRELKSEEIGRHWLLQRVWEWLSADEVFCILE
jgi:hypothetical protein